MISFIRQHKLISALVSLIVVGALWYLFRPEKLFINKRVNEAAPFTANGAAQAVYTGKLIGKVHETSGRATVYRQGNGSLTLRLTDFHTSNGPDVHVVLTTADDPPKHGPREGFSFG